MSHPPRSRPVLAAATLLALPLLAQAHMTWLLPNATVVTDRDGVVVIDAAVSEDLFTFERELKLDQLTVTGPRGLRVQPSAVTAARNHDTFEVKLPENGVYRIDNLSRALMGSYRLNGETSRLRSTPATLDKDLPAGAELLGLTESTNRQQTFVSRGEDANTPDFAPAGVGLELIPLTPVTDLSAGDASRFRLLLDGRPQADTDISLRRGGNRYRYKMGEETFRTDARGEFAVTWAEPGQYWLGASTGERGGMGMGPGSGAGPGGPGGNGPNRAEGGAGRGRMERGPGGPPMPMPTGGTREKPLQRATLSATFEVVPK